MAADLETDLQLEIAHVLFVDIVGYSKLLINEQHESLGETKSSEALTPFKLPMLRKNLFVCPLSRLIEDRKRKRRDQARRSVKS
jgi:hypothetical protein